MQASTLNHPVRFETRKLVVTAMLLAVTAILIFVPNLGMIQIGVVSITTIHIPVLIGVLAEGLGVGLVLGLAFGLCSFLKAFSGVTLFDVFFTDPLISIPSRVLVPIAAILVYKLFQKLTHDKPAMRKLGWSLAAIAGSLTNTAATLFMLYIRKFSDIQGMGLDAKLTDNFFAFIVGIGGINCLVEAAAAALFVPAVLIALRASTRRR